MNAYSFRDVTATLVGPTGNVNLGYGSNSSDEGITIEPNGDKNTMTIGADGGGMHSLAADRSGTVSVTLLQTSAVNSQLMAMYDAQIAASSLWGQNVITVVQNASGDITTCTRCAFKKKPGVPYKRVGGTLEWQFDVIFMDTVLGTY